MENKLTIKQQFVVNGRIFQNKEDAQKYIEIVEEERTKNEYNDTVYYENWTTYGNEGERKIVRARWQTYEEALNAMQNYVNAYCQNGTGWIEKVTIKTENNQVFVESKCVYTRMYSKQ